MCAHTLHRTHSQSESSWLRVVSGLQVTLLFNDVRAFPPVTLGSETRRHRLTSLTPGRLYKIVVSTFSGPNQRAQFIEGRTGETSRGGNAPGPAPPSSSCVALLSV